MLIDVTGSNDKLKSLQNKYGNGFKEYMDYLMNTLGLDSNTDANIIISKIFDKAEENAETLEKLNSALQIQIENQIDGYAQMTAEQKTYLAGKISEQLAADNSAEAVKKITENMRALTSETGWY